MKAMTLINNALDQHERPVTPARSPFEVQSISRSWLYWDDEREERWRRQEEAFIRLAKSMKKRGAPTMPLLVAEEGPRKFRVIDGVGRVLAGDTLVFEDYEAYIIGDLDVAEGFLSLNLCRFDVHPVTLARHLKQLKMTTAFSHEQLGEIIGKSREAVTQILPIADLPDDVLAKALTIEPMPSLSHYIALAASRGTVQEEVLEKIANGAPRSVLRKARSDKSTKPRPIKRSITAMIKRVDETADILSRVGQEIGYSAEDAMKWADLKARVENLLSTLVERCQLVNLTPREMLAGEHADASNSGGER